MCISTTRTQLYEKVCPFEWLKNQVFVTNKNGNNYHAYIYYFYICFILFNYLCNIIIKLKNNGIVLIQQQILRFETLNFSLLYLKTYSGV